MTRDDLDRLPPKGVARRMHRRLRSTVAEKSDADMAIETGQRYVDDVEEAR